MSLRLGPSLICGIVNAVLAASEGQAQLILPGAAPAASQGAATAPAKPKHPGASAQGGEPSAKNAKAPAAPSVAGLVGRPLLLNGKSGLLQISGDDKTVTIDKLQLAGEGVSDPSQSCIVDIIGEKPIEATNAGRPDGLERFEADIPACPISFDILDGAALVPSQISACVFKAADCQTSPGGLWGPDGSSLVGDAAKIVKDRAQAEKAMGKVLQAIEALAKDRREAANLVRDQTAFAGERDAACKDYVKESVHGFCALRLTEARTALLQARLDELRAEGAPTAASDKGKKTKPKKGSQQP
jgi:hypothetical protein